MRWVIAIVVLVWTAPVLAATTTVQSITSVEASNLVTVETPDGPMQVTLTGVCAVTLPEGRTARESAYFSSMLREGIAALLRDGPLSLDYSPGPLPGRVIGSFKDGQMDVNKLVAAWLKEQRYECE